MFIDGHLGIKGQADWDNIPYGKVYYDYTRRNGVLTKSIFMKSLYDSSCYIRIADKWFEWENYRYYDWWAHRKMYNENYAVDPDYD